MIREYFNMDTKLKLDLGDLNDKLSKISKYSSL